MKNKERAIGRTQAVILFLMLTVTLHILGLKVNGAAAGSELISAYLDYGSKILGAILITEMLLFLWLTPMKLNRRALRCSVKADGKALAQSAVIAILIVAALIAFRFYMNAKNPAYREIPLFGLYLNVHTRWLYPVSIIFQEFFIKAFTQENIGAALRSGGAEEKPSGRNGTVTCRWFFGSCST
ncbi:MAG: hypothetical protein IKN53_00940, partial [Oscillibacter sp.]|nr:hypothetical protein [Oscillibacter sp.]